MVQPLPTIEGGFGTLLADPPWAFRTYDGKRQTPHRDHRGAGDHYAVTETHELCSLPVSDVAAKDAALFMWVVDSHFPDALALGAAWGFEFKTCAFTLKPSVAVAWWGGRGVR